MPRWSRIRRRADRPCARPPTGCCAPVRARASSSNGWKRAFPCRRATAAAMPSRHGAIADQKLNEGNKKGAYRGALLFLGRLAGVLAEGDPDILRDAVPVQQQQRVLLR